MNTLTETICVKRWHAFVLLGLSGYAVGSVIANLVNAFGL